MKTTRLLIAAAISMAFAASASAQTGTTVPQYTIVDIGLPIGDSVDHTSGISDNGTYVVGRGSIAGSNNAYVWTQSGGMTVLPAYAGDADNWATSVNSSGLVVGMASTSPQVNTTATYYTTAPTPVMWQTSGSGVTAVPLALPTGQVQGRVFDVNDNGLAVGSVGVAGGIGERAVIYNTSSGTTSYITASTSDGETMREATQINDAGLVIGVAVDGSVLAYDSVSGTMSRVANLDANGNVLSALTGSFAVNASGTVVGFTGTTVTPIAATWSAGGGMTTLSPLAGTTNSRAVGINSQGWIVMSTKNATNGHVDPQLVIGGQTYELSSLIADASGWTIANSIDTTITGIADNGVITGYTTNLADNAFEAFALVPVPEPATCVLMLGGLLAIGAITRRRGAMRNC